MSKCVVVGLGEIGRPLLELIQTRHTAMGVDLDPVHIEGECEIMHICYPFQIDDFVKTTAEYIRKYRPGLTIVNSTVIPGTTRAIAAASGLPVVYSPVRGKHAHMKEELLHYVKFVGGLDRAGSEQAAEHFKTIGMKTRILSSPEAAELAKLSETTYFGVLITWAQEVERYCDQLGLDYDEIIAFYEEIKYLPPTAYFPGVIAGHCVMPNVKLLQTLFTSKLLDTIESSNQLKIARETARTIEISARCDLQDN